MRRDAIIAKEDLVNALNEIVQEQVLNVAVGTKVDQKAGEVLVGFDGWGPKYDEWVGLNSGRIKPFLSVADGGKERTCQCALCKWQKYFAALCEHNEFLTADLI